MCKTIVLLLSLPSELGLLPAYGYCLHHHSHNFYCGGLCDVQGSLWRLLLPEAGESCVSKLIKQTTMQLTVFLSGLCLIHWFW